MHGTTRRHRQAAFSGAVVAALLALTACAGGDDGTDGTTSGSPSAPAPTTSASPSPAVTDSPSGPSDDSSGTPPVDAALDTSTKLADPSSDALLSVTDIRIGRHDGFDRVVYELGGTGTPGWRVEYVDEAIEDGSGKVVPLDGDGNLQVTISGTGYPADTGQTEYSGPSPLRVADTDEVEEVVFLGVFEGLTQSFIGTDEVNPFRVYALSEPTRVVVDIRNDDT